MLFFSLQKKLHALSVECDNLDSEISQRRDLLQRIETEAVVVDKVRPTHEVQGPSRLYPTIAGESQG